jgi:hypothetical protein
VRLSPGGWLQQHALGADATLAEDSAQQSVSTRESRAAWARLLAKVYEVDLLTCSRCGSPMKVRAVITDPPQVRRILLHADAICDRIVHTAHRIELKGEYPEATAHRAMKKRRLSKFSG